MKYIKWILAVAYVYFILNMTVIGREQQAEYIFKGLFWEVQNGMWSDIAKNIILFVPLGFIVGGVKGIATGLILSVGVETIQYFGKLGYCEADDVLNNTIGVSLDELPQLFDVLEGNMSFVGTRPEAVKYVEVYKSEYNATLLMPAGITSEASIRYKEEDKLLKDADNVDKVYVEQVLPGKMEWNLRSIKEFRFLREIQTIIHTLLAIWVNNNVRR